MTYKGLRLLSAFLLFVFVYGVFAQDNKKPLQVGVMLNEPPISFKAPNGEMKGIGVDLWREIAKDRQWQYKLIPIEATIDGAIKQFKQNKFDLLIGPIAVTNPRLRQVQFSRPYFLSRIGVAVPDQPKSFWTIIHTFFRRPVIITVLAFLGLFIIFTHAYWLFERQHASLIDRRYRWGIWHATWETVTSFLRDVLHDPETIGGRITLALWLVCSVTFMTLFTAVITSSLTLTLFKHHSPIEKPQDLLGKTVAVEKGSEAAKIAANLGASIVKGEKPVEDLKKLDAKQYDAVIAPYSTINKELQLHPQLKVHLTPVILTNESFAFMVPRRTQIHEQLNLSLTKLQDQGFARNLCSQYGIHFTHSCDF